MAGYGEKVMNKTDGYDFLYKLSYKSGPECDFRGGTRKEFDIWKAQTLEKVKTMFGFDRLESVPYNAEKLESEEAERGIAPFAEKPVKKQKKKETKNKKKVTKAK